MLPSFEGTATPLRVRPTMPFTIEEATPDHAPAIAKIFLSNETDEFLKLQFGTVDPAVMRQGLTERLAENIKASGQVYVIARDEETGEVASYCSWTLPRDLDEPYVRQSAEVSNDFLDPRGRMQG